MGDFILAKLTTVFTMEKTFGNICNRDWARRCGITCMFIISVFQIACCKEYSHVLEDCGDSYSGIRHKYDPFREICCDGKVFDNSFQEYDCHRSSSGLKLIYLVREEFFCGDQRLQIHGERKCCGQEVYDPEVWSCCESQLLPKQDNMECCGMELINITKKTCCQGYQIVDGVGECCGSNTLYNYETQVCVHNRVYDIPPDGDPLSFYGICGEAEGQLYDVEKESCCDGNLRVKSNNTKCEWDQWYDPAENALNPRLHVVRIVDGKTRPCGSEMYNPNIEVCCWSLGELTITNVGSANGACCGSKAYSRDNASCCGGVVTEGIPEIPGIQACSGTVSYLTSGNISCSQELVIGRPSNDEVDCCGGEMYFLNESVCCMGEIRERVGTGVCCGTSVLLPNQHCINDEIVRGKEGDDSLCELYPATYSGFNQMPVRVMPYNSNLFICKNGALVVKKPKTKYCAGSGKIYNTDTEICCGNVQVFSKKNEWDMMRRCCGYDSYHPEVQSCHHTHIYQFPEKFAERCGFSLFDTRSLVCINNHIFAKSVTHLTPANCEDFGLLRAFGQSCCHGKPINDTTHLCCNDRVYSKDGMEEASCCSGRVYDNASSEFLCCDDRLHRTGGVAKTCVGRLAVADYEQVCGDMVYNKSDGQCCGDGLFNNDTQLCCDEVRIKKESPNDVCCGTTKYNKFELQICCNGALYDQTDGFQCCGSSFIDLNRDICVGDQYVVSKKFEEFTCNVSVTGDPTGTCCAGVKHVQKFGSCRGVHLDEGSNYYNDALVEGPEEVLSSCGDEEYSEATQTCCGGKVIRNGNKICCNGKARKVTDLGENSCCGTRAYNNESSICCSEQIRDKSSIQRARDAEGCCEEGKSYDLESGQCQEKLEEDEDEEEAEGGDCSICQDSKRRKDEISNLACGAMHHLVVKVTRTLAKKNSLVVRTSPLFKNCWNCPSSFNKRELKGLKQLLLPENCDCEVENGRYILLSSGELDEEGRLILQSSDVLLPSKAAKIVRDVFKKHLC